MNTVNIILYSKNLHFQELGQKYPSTLVRWSFQEDLEETFLMFIIDP